MSSEPISLPTPGPAATRVPAADAAYREPRWLQYSLMAIAFSYVAVLVLVPVANILDEAFSDGWAAYRAAITDPNTISALKLSLKVSAIAVVLNAVFGIAAAWALTKFDFRGKALLLTLIDLPLAVSPVVAGLVFLLIFGNQGYIGPWFRENAFQVVFATPGIVLATVFVTFPLVARSVIPVMEAVGKEYEEAAVTLGASGWQTFFFVTLPSVKWGLLYGLVLCNARALGEFGAVSVISGKITGKTDTLPLRIEKLDKAFDTQSAFAIASLLVAVAVITLVARSIIEWRTAAIDN